MNSGSILIVDDSDNIRNVLQMNFEWLGYNVRCARDGEEALRIVKRDSPDLIILDVMMPRRNGYQVCRALKADESTRGIPVVFLTAKDQEGDRFWGRDCGADEYLTKPFSAARLEQVIARLISKHRRGDVAGDITARIQMLTSQGAPCSSISFVIDPKALQVYRQKYGEMRYQSVLEGLRRVIEEHLRRESPDALLERAGDTALRAVISCAGDEADLKAERTRMEADLYLRGVYDREDAERGYVVTRVGADGGEINVPLLRVEATVKQEAHAA